MLYLPPGNKEKFLDFYIYVCRTDSMAEKNKGCKHLTLALRGYAPRSSASFTRVCVLLFQPVCGSAA